MHVNRRLDQGNVQALVSGACEANVNGRRMPVWGLRLHHDNLPEEGPWRNPDPFAEQAFPREIQTGVLSGFVGACGAVDWASARALRSLASEILATLSSNRRKRTARALTSIQPNWRVFSNVQE